MMDYILLILIAVLKYSRADQTDSKAVVINGDLLLGGLFPIHEPNRMSGCSDKINVDGVLALEAFLHSLDSTNRDLKAKYGFTLGAIALDTCNSDRVALFNALKFVIRDYLKQKGRRKGDVQDLDTLWSPFASVSQNITGALDHDVIGIVGPWSSSVSLQVANLFSLFRMPQVSYGATTSTLSNRRSYPYFLRTVPSDSNQARVLLEILKAWNWTYIIGAYEDTNYGSQGFHEFEKVVDNSDICFADRWKINVDQVQERDIRAKLRRLASWAPEAKAFVLYMHSGLVEMIMRAAIEEGLENRFIWIGTDGWGNKHIPTDIRPALEGAIVSLPVQKSFPSFMNHFYTLHPSKNTTNIWFKEFWRHNFQCENKKDIECWSNKSLNNSIKAARFGSMHNVRDAVFAFSNALQRMHEKGCPRGRMGICYRLKRWLSDPDRKVLLEYLQNSTFEGLDKSEVSFLDGHDGLPNYTILNYQKMDANTGNETDYEWMTIGSVKADLESGLDQFLFDHSSSAKFKKSLPFPTSICGLPCPPGSIRRHKQNRCCWSCEQCPFPTYRLNESHCDSCPTLDADTDTPTFFKPTSSRDACELIRPDFVHYFNNAVVAIVSMSSSLGLFLSLITLILFLWYARTPIIKASGRELSVALLSGISVCYSTVFIVAANPNAYTCALSRFFYSTGYTVCYGSIFIKTNRIARIFSPGNVYVSLRRHSTRNTKRPSLGGSSLKRMRYISPLSQMLFVTGLVIFQTIINIVWLILRPPSPAYKLHHDYEFQKVTLYKFCRAFENEDMVIALLFPVTLLLFASFYAFKTRKCPGKFNEMKYIVITTYTTCIVWLAFIPVFFATDLLHLRIYAMCASLCINATVTLFCMFAPKLFVAIYQPQKNTKDAVMGKKERTSSAPPSPSPYRNCASDSCQQWNFPSTRSSMISAFDLDAANGDSSGTDATSRRESLLPRGGSMRALTNETRKGSGFGDRLTVPKSRFRSEQYEGGKGSLLLVPPKSVFANGDWKIGRQCERRRKSL